MYGRLIWIATNEIPKIRKIRVVARSLRTPRSDAKATSTIRPVGTTSGRTSFEPRATSSAVPIERSAENAKTGGSAQPKPSMKIPATAGPTANPTGPETPKSAIVVPIRARGVTSRIPASMIPVLPSWNPMSNIARATCHGSRARATATKTTASTSALRMMTTLRLYLSAHAPHSGTSGIPTTKISALKIPMKASRSLSGTPICRRYVGNSAKIWLTPTPSTIEVTQKTATRMRQSCPGRAGTGPRVVMGAVDIRDSLSDILRSGGPGSRAARAETAHRVGHTKAPEGTGGDLRSTGPEAANKSAVPGHRRVPRSPALRPATLVPGTVPRITPRTGLAVLPAPSGKTKCTTGPWPPQRGCPRT